MNSKDIWALLAENDDRDALRSKMKAVLESWRLDGRRQEASSRRNKQYGRRRCRIGAGGKRALKERFRRMTYRPLLTSRSLIPVAALLAVVIIAISPRSLLAPSLSFSQAQESKRPKTPKNIVRTDPAGARAGERSRSGPRPSPEAGAVRETAGLPVRPALASGLPDRAFLQITLPGYLKLFGGSPPGNRLAPPA